MPEGVAPLDRSPEPLRVLLVTDDDRSRGVLRPVLSGVGFEVLEARDGLAGLQRVIEDAPSLVVLAADLPGLDGFALRDQLRTDRETSGIPVLVCTAGAGPREEARRPGPGPGVSEDVLALGDPVDVLRRRIREAARRADGAPPQVHARRSA